jgi:hypothetical protein
MKHINPKIARLLHEGISMSTLENMSNGQLNLLYKKIVKEQSSPTSSSSGVLNIPSSDSTGIQDAKTKKQKFVTYEKELDEKALSKKQQQFFGIVRGMQKGDTPKKGKAGEAAKEMKQKDVKDFAKTKHKGLPTRKTKKTETKEQEDQVKKLEENIMSLVEKHLYPEFSKRDLLKNLNKR